MVNRLAASAVLALAAHAAALWWLGWSPTRAGSNAQGPGLHVRLTRELLETPAAETLPTDAAVAEAPAEKQAPSTSLTEAEANSAATAVERNTIAPSLAADAAVLSMPDAVLPDAGLRLRAWVEVDREGNTATVSTDANAEQAPAVASALRWSLQQTRLLGDDQLGRPGQYCLRVSYEAGANQAKVEWLPNASSDAARCLTGPIQTALRGVREIDRRGSPAPP